MDNKERTLQEKVVAALVTEVLYAECTLNKYAAAIKHCDNSDSQDFLADEAISKCFDMIRSVEGIIDAYDKKKKE